jgi:hypothetical protein
LLGHASSEIIVGERVLTKAVAKQAAEQSLARTMSTSVSAADDGGLDTGVGLPDDVEPAPEADVADDAAGFFPDRKAADPQAGLAAGAARMDNDRWLRK